MKMGFIRTGSKFEINNPVLFFSANNLELNIQHQTTLGWVWEHPGQCTLTQRNFKDLCLRASEIGCAAWV